MIIKDFKFYDTDDVLTIHVCDNGLVQVMISDYNHSKKGKHSIPIHLELEQLKEMKKIISQIIEDKKY